MSGEIRLGSGQLGTLEDPKLSHQGHTLHAKCPPIQTLDSPATCSGVADAWWLEMLHSHTWSGYAMLV